MTGQQYEAMSAYLWKILQEGELDDYPWLARRVWLALRARDRRWIPSVFDFVRMRAPFPLREREPVRLWREADAERLTGRILVGNTIPSGHPVFVPHRSFGGDSHFEVVGAAGTGKSWLIDWIAVQLMQQDIRLVIFDTLDQTAAKLVPVIGPERLRIIDYRNYRRNPFWDEEDQAAWIHDAYDCLADSLDLTPVAMNILMRTCDEILSENRIVTIPEINTRLERTKGNAASKEAILNRLLELARPGEETFSCPRGFDLGQLLTKSVIFRLREGTNRRKRKLLFNDLYQYITRKRRPLSVWRLNEVFVFHEAADILNRGDDNEFFLKTIKECRNFGVGLLFANQQPHLEHSYEKSNIGTRCIFRLEEQAAVEMFRIQLGLTDEQKNFIMNMPRRVMVMKRPGIEFPFLVRVPNLTE